MKNFSAILSLAGVVCGLCTDTHSAHAQTTTFIYQGFLTDQGGPANGTYDLTFTLFNAATGGATVGASNVVSDLPITNGLFSVILDYGSASFDGSDRWLEIALRPGESMDAYTNVSPRQLVTATPYAVRAATATGFTGAIVDAQLSANVALLNSSPTFAGTVSASSFGGNGSGLTSLSAGNLTGSVPPSSLTSVPAGNLTDTVVDARLSANVALRSGGNTFNGDQIFSTGNVGIGTNTPATKLDVAGEVTTTACNITSDRNAKEQFRPVNARDVLDKVTRLPISEWQYKEQPEARHIGPMAQDFRAAFAVGRDEKHITTVDADGVALAAIQGLNEKLEEKDTELSRLKSENQALAGRLAAIERMLGMRGEASPSRP